MVDRTLISPVEQMRDFDFVSFEHDVLMGLGALAQGVLSGAASAVITGMEATQSGSPNLTISIAPGQIFVRAVADLVGNGSILQDPTTVVQQGLNAGQTLTFVPPIAGRSQWNLVQCQFSQSDEIRANDPNNGQVPFYNDANPTVPNILSIDTVRRGLCIISVITGSSAITGSELPPQPSAGWTPMYLIDLVGGQTQITTAQIRKTAPSVGTGVPGDYPGAPFLAGFLAQHHLGIPGHAPKINLATEAAGVLPYPNMSPVRVLLAGNLTLYVNNTTGNDTNTGVSPGTPFKTIQAAVDSMNHNYDFNGFSCTISVANGTYAVSPGTNGWAVSFLSSPVGIGAGAINLIGNTASPGSVTLTVTNGNGIRAVGTLVNVSGLTVTASGSNQGILTALGYGIGATGGGWINLSNCVLGTCGTAQVYSVNGSVVTFNGPMTLTGTTIYALAVQVGAQIWIVGATVTVTGLTVSGAFAFASQSGTVNATGNTFVGSATGPRYAVNAVSNINTSGGGANYLPGNSAGAASNNGVYT